MTVEQRHRSGLLWMIIGGISVVVLLFLATQWFLNKDSDTPVKTVPPAVPQQEISSTVISAKQIASDTAPTSAPQATVLVDQGLLKAAVPEHPAQAKEEIAKLDEIQAQLAEQEKMLKAQHDNADTLIQLKQEQIKLLEAQLAETQDHS